MISGEIFSVSGCTEVRMYTYNIVHIHIYLDMLINISVYVQIRLKQEPTNDIVMCIGYAHCMDINVKNIYFIFGGSKNMLRFE